MLEITILEIPNYTIRFVKDVKVEVRVKETALLQYYFHAFSFLNTFCPFYILLLWTTNLHAIQ